MNHLIAKVMFFLTGGQSGFAFPLSHQWHGINVAPPLYLIAFAGALLAIGLLGYCVWRKVKGRPSVIAFLAMLLSATAAYAASSTLANLSAASAISAGDLLYVVQSGADYRATAAQIAAYVNANIGILTGCQATGGPLNGGSTVSTQLVDSVNSPLVTTPYTLRATDACNVLRATSGASAIVLPNPTTTGFGLGETFRVSNQTGSAMTWSTTASGGYTGIDGAASGTIPIGDTLAFYSDGTNYHWSQQVALNPANNLSDVGSASTTRTNLAVPGTATANTFTGANTFAEVLGAVTAQTGTSYTFAATDCGTEVDFTNSGAVTATIPETLPIGCNIAVLQAGASKVSVNGSAVAAATLYSAHSYTGTSAQYAIIGINIEANSGGSSAIAILTGDGS